MLPKLRRDRHAERDRTWPPWTARLRARLGLPPDHHAAVMAALRRDDRPLRLAYSRQAGTAIADLRDRLAMPEDHDRLAWPCFEDYREMIFASQKRSGRQDRHRLWESGSATIERAFRIDGLDFRAVITGERCNLVREVEFVSLDPNRAGHAVELAPWTCELGRNRA